MGGKVTVVEAKETLISLIDYVAYREIGTGLYDSDKNLLFGEKHYKSGRPVYSRSPWEGKRFEAKMAMLLKTAKCSKSTAGQYRDAIRHLRFSGGAGLNRVIVRSWLV